MAWGSGQAYSVLSGAQHWYAEIKFYTPGTPLPADLSNFKAAHYTQMVWKSTTEIGAGKATIQQGEKQGWTVVVCNYNPPGNMVGEKPY
jgi:pathogenesis-related protein 1